MQPYELVTVLRPQLRALTRLGDRARQRLHETVDEVLDSPVGQRLQAGLRGEPVPPQARAAIRHVLGDVGMVYQMSHDDDPEPGAAMVLAEILRRLAPQQSGPAQDIAIEIRLKAADENVMESLGKVLLGDETSDETDDCCERVRSILRDHDVEPAEGFGAMVEQLCDLVEQKNESD